MNKVSESTRNSRRLPRRLVLAAALMLVATATTAEGRGCYTAEVPGTMVLPDGSEHTSGLLRICTDQVISPVSNLHRISVGGRPVGMFLSLPRAIEEAVEGGTAQFIFKRGVSDELILVGYGVTAGGGRTIYEMVRAEYVRDTANSARTDPGQRDDMVVLLASRR